jgi:putative tryptophan/tyrosine transport system substrate-binding protein
MSLLAGTIVTAPETLRAQQAMKARRVGVLFARSGRGSVPDDAFRLGLRERGYVEGRNLIVEFRSAGSKYNDLPELAMELVREKVEVIFAPVEAALRACLQVSRTIPIVFAAMGYDPIGLGLVGSTVRPGRNVTGVIFDQIGPSGRQIELLKVAVPSLRRVTVLSGSPEKFRLDETERIAQSFQLDFRVVEGGFDAVFQTVSNDRTEAIILLVSPDTYAERGVYADLARSNQVPTIAPFSEFAEAGGLLSYGSSVASMFHYAAHYVDRILRGNIAAELQLEQPPKFELCINMTTAKVLGLTMPDSLVSTADHVFE